MNHKTGLEENVKGRQAAVSFKVLFCCEIRHLTKLMNSFFLEIFLSLIKPSFFTVSNVEKRTGRNKKESTHFLALKENHP